MHRICPRHNHNRRDHGDHGRNVKKRVHDLLNSEA
jgi:hypothetical protein